MTDATGCVVLASASTCDLSFSRPCVGFGMFAFCSPCPYACAAAAVCCPVPAASDDAVLIPGLPSLGMLMTDGTHSATGITVIDGRLILLRPPVAVVAPGCLSACTPRRPAGYNRPQSAHYRRGPRARMSGVTDPGHRRRPGPRQARTAPAARTLLGFNREMPGFHPRTVRVLIPGAPNKNPHSPGN